MITKYKMLVNALDSICAKAPEKFSSYKIDGKSNDEINNIRARAYIHLFLLVKFGVQSFAERHDSYITDGTNDGGIDAYYIDSTAKKIYLIQSKFRMNQANYETTEIEPSELVKMEIKNITSGKTTGFDGNQYNGKILSFQRKLSELSNLALYKYEIIVLANLYRKDTKRLAERLFDGIEYVVYDYEKAYDELLFPFSSSTFFQNDTIVVDKNVQGVTDCYKETFESTSYGKCGVSLFFAPLRFIAELVDEYKNSILLYNPRNYLSFCKNPVNKSIANTLEKDNEDFALLNNGITIICSDFRCSTQNGLDGSTNLFFEDPQIINGGQTGFTLSRMMHSNAQSLENKKVLVKVIATYKRAKEERASKEEKEDLVIGYGKFVNSISDATNMQTRIEESDRRSNLESQQMLQKRVFKYYGLLYERKRGEFEEATSNKVFSEDQIIKRDVLIRCLVALDGNSVKAMNEAKAKLFSEESFKKVINKNTTASDVVFSYGLYNLICKYEKDYKMSMDPNWGNGLKYGKYALISVAGELCRGRLSENSSLGDINNLTEKMLVELLQKWGQFEEFAAALDENKAFHLDGTAAFYKYYKNQKSQEDIKRYWKKKRLDENCHIVDKYIEEEMSTND